MKDTWELDQEMQEIHERNYLEMMQMQSELMRDIEREEESE